MKRRVVERMVTLVTGGGSPLLECDEALKHNHVKSENRM